MCVYICVCPHCSDRSVPCLLCHPGAVLLDLDQKTLPGIAHQVVEQMIISDQIKAEDRANVLRALLLKHRYSTTATPANRLAQLSEKDTLES